MEGNDTGVSSILPKFLLSRSCKSTKTSWMISRIGCIHSQVDTHRQQHKERKLLIYFAQGRIFQLIFSCFFLLFSYFISLGLQKTVLFEGAEKKSCFELSTPGIFKRRSSPIFRGTFQTILYFSSKKEKDGY